MTTTNDTRTTSAERSSQLRLALIELARIEREIEALENRPYDAREHELLTSLRSCRAVLLRMADVVMRGPREVTDASHRGRTGSRIVTW